MVARDALPPFPNSEAAAVQGVWTWLQTVLLLVKRWHRFVGVKQKIRRQDLLQHTLSLIFLGVTMLERLRTDLTQTLDDRIIFTCLLLHDWGEGRLKRDVSLTKKQAHDDAAEYQAFCLTIKDLTEDLRYYLQSAFLLQFVLDDDKWLLFDNEAQEILEVLRRKRRDEAIMFMLIEHWDYIMYMVEQYKRGNAYLLHEAMKTEVPIWPKLKELCPAFGEKILTPELEAWFMEFRRLYVQSGRDTRSTDEIKAARAARVREKRG